MTHVTCRLTTKNRNQLRNPTLGNRVLATFTLLFYFWLFTLSQIKTICNPLAHPSWKCTTLTCEILVKLFLSNWRFALYLHFPYLRFPYMRFPSLRNALFRTCLYRTCVFQYLRFQRPPTLLSLGLMYVNKKLSYRRGTTGCVVSVEISPIATP